MSHGDEGRGPSQSATMSDPNRPESPERQWRSNVRPYVAEVEKLIEHYRNGRRTKFEVIASITKYLFEDEELTSKEKTQSLELYLAEINAIEKAGEEGSEGGSSD